MFENRTLTPAAGLVEYLINNGFQDVTDKKHPAREMMRWRKSLPKEWAAYASELPVGARLFFHSPLHRNVLLTADSLSLAGLAGIAFTGPKICEDALWYWLDHKNTCKAEKEEFKRLVATAK
jgi:hypothetical protein